MYLPWVDGFRLCILGDFEQMRDLEIRFGRRRWPHQERLVHGRSVLRELVSLGVDADSADAEAVDSACDSTSDLASIRNQDFVEHSVGVSKGLAQGNGFV